jgi:hypothetical protein
MNKIIIEEDGWVHIEYDPPKQIILTDGLGDIGVDVVIEDRRQLSHHLVSIKK